MIRFIATVRAAVTILAIVIGGPILLTTIAGPPIPRHWPSNRQIQAWLDEPLNPAYAAGTAHAFAWTLWLIITAAITVAVVAQLGRLRWPALAGCFPRPAQGLTAALLGTAAITTTVTGPAAAATVPAHDSMPAEPHTATAIPKLITTSGAITGGVHVTPAAHPGTATVSPLASAEHGPQTQIPPWARKASGGTHRVAKGDNLWDIAEQQLGDPVRWHEIYRLNHGKPQADGAALHDPDELRIGWVLALPARHHTTDPSQPSASPPATTPRAPATTTTSPGAAAETTVPSTAPAINTAPSTLTTPGAQTGAQAHATDDRSAGVTLPSQSWISLGLATTIATVATLLRLRRRRTARLTTPIPVHTGAARSPVPPGLAVADVAGRRNLVHAEQEPDGRDNRPGRTARPITPRVPAPIGVDSAGTDISLFTLARIGLALDGPGMRPAGRAMLASALATRILDAPPYQPVVATSTAALARLLPDGAPVTGLDPQRETFDGERLIVLADTNEAIIHAEEEMIARRQLLDEFHAESITELNARTDHLEAQPPYVLLIDADTRHAGRLAAVAAHTNALDLYIITLGPTDTFPTVTAAADGTITTAETPVLAGGRLATLAPSDLTHLLTMISEAAPRPEAGTDIEAPTDPVEAAIADRHHGDDPAGGLDTIPDLPADTPPLVRLSVLGPIAATTDNGPVTTGMRSGSYAVLALLAAHPRGRTLDQFAAHLHPDTDQAVAVKRVRTDITTVRRVLREATGATKQMFIHHDPATGRYRLDPNAVEVDLWRMLTAIGRANTATDDATALAALHEAADLYAGDFADGRDQAWATDYATTARLQILGVYARIAELLETEQPDAAVAALEQAVRYDPVNEELYQRIIRIHGRQHRPDAVRRTLRRLEDQLADIGAAEPSEATIRLATRQLRPAATGVRA